MRSKWQKTVHNIYKKQSDAKWESIFQFASPSSQACGARLSPGGDKHASRAMRFSGATQIVLFRESPLVMGRAHLKGQAVKKKSTEKITRVERLRHKLKMAQEDKASGVITLTICLTGVLADAWRSLRAAADGLKLSDSDLFGMLLSAAVRQVRANLRSLLREA